MLLRRPIMVKEPLWSSRTIIGWQVANTNYFLFFYLFAIALLCYYKIWSKINISLIFSSCANSNTLDIISAVFGSSSINGKKILPLC
mgnify:FL=1